MNICENVLWIVLKLDNNIEGLGGREYLGWLSRPILTFNVCTKSQFKLNRIFFTVYRNQRFQSITSNHVGKDNKIHNFSTQYFKVMSQRSG